MKKMTAGLGILLLSTVVLGSQQVFADATTPEATSNGTVLFEVDTDVKPPIVVPPTGPDGPGIVDLDNSDGVQGDGTASFNISYVSHFRFNDYAANLGKDDVTGKLFQKFVPIKLNANGMTLFAKGTHLTINPVDKDNVVITPIVPNVYTNIPNFVQVIDNRGGSTGWQLTATATEFKGKDTAGKEHVLAGAKLTLNDATLKGGVGVAAPQIDFATEGFAELNASPKPLMTAKAQDSGTGSWSLKFGDEVAPVTPDTYETLVKDTGVKLEIPASAGTKAAVQYSSDIVWTLTDAPFAP